MNDLALPPRSQMLEAFLQRDAAWDGVFFTGVRTTGVFCRPTCPARKPKARNVEFFPSPREALLAGYRPCRRCHPLRMEGTSQVWLGDLVKRVEADPSRRWSDADLTSLGLSPSRVRRGFKSAYGMSFHAYCRARRLGAALGMLKNGETVTRTAFDSGYDSLSAFNEAFREVLGSTPTEARRRPVVRLARIPTPLGPVLAGATEQGLCLLEFADRRMLETQLTRLRDRLGALLVPGGHPHLEATERELRAYFRGEAEGFTVPLVLPGTEFQGEVWRAVGEVPYGETVSYGALARRLGRPEAPRAVARALGDNRVAVVVPCHRVVGADGSLTGYGGGLWRKRRLLELEQGVSPFGGMPGISGPGR
jgi:AraC family transcriptional regulator of adaptative response/methylated-DNA-[protein]-cysteine methyltransferase